MAKKTNAEYQRDYRARKKLEAEALTNALPVDDGLPDFTPPRATLGPPSFDRPDIPRKEDPENNVPVFDDRPVPRSNYNLPDWPETIQNMTQQQRDAILEKIATPRRTPR